MPNQPTIIHDPSECTDRVVELAEKLYAAYTANSENKNYQGLECPAWDALPASVRSHWCAVAVCALG